MVGPAHRPARLRQPEDAHAERRASVAAPGGPTIAAAIQAASSVPGSPFSVCRPGPTGSAAIGTFETPDGKSLPPLTLRCWADVTQENGFDVVSL
jgi:hypothetical protein